ncbi:MAG: type IV pilin N-terminal domain-containing protein [Methanolobus sp.]|nr:type IV pilin N-terminal domain-containing protein [Methanolobus sp.]
MNKQIPMNERHNSAMSPIVGVVLMLFLTLLFAGITVSSVYGEDIAASLTKTPMAMIGVEFVEGGVPNAVRYNENFLYLAHMGGDPLMTGDTKILISGQGSAYEGTVPHGRRHYGEVIISYDNLLYEGKRPEYASGNGDISDGVWSSGEKLVLNGYDSINGTVFSSVSVSINGIKDTSNNYGLKAGNIISIKVIDKNTDRIISECEHMVVPAK